MSSIFGAINLAACGYQIYNFYHENLFSEKKEGKMNMTSIFFILIGAALSSIVSLNILLYQFLKYVFTILYVVESYYQHNRNLYKLKKPC